MKVQDTTAIKCTECGSPSYFDQKLEGFVCPYCGNFTPWDAADYRYTLDMVFRHRPVPIIDGLIKLTHVGTGHTRPRDIWPDDELKHRTASLDKLLFSFDKGTFNLWEERQDVSFDCPYCNGKINGFSTQSLFLCEYCGNKIMHADVFETGLYGENLVYGVDRNMHDLALPFKLTKTQAIDKMLNLVRKYPEDFAGENIEERIKSDLQAIYLPYLLEDHSVKATVSTERGKFTFYHDRINWARPENSLFDIYLLNKLDPWDYGEVAPFTPTFLENDAKIFAPINNEERKTAPYRMLYRDIPDMIKETFGLKYVKLESWVTNFRRHKYSYINLPIWYLDKATEAGESDLQIRMAVNGQTGKAAALFLQADKKDYIRTLDLDARMLSEMSDESTIYSPPIPVKYMRSPFLFKRLDINQVLRHPLLSIPKFLQR